MQNRFSIGEMSRLMNVPIKTLRYYDEIGLFKPVEVNRDTGYRYYSTEQFEQLDIIKYLRLLGAPLAEIAAHFTQLRVENFLQLLKRQEKTSMKKYGSCSRPAKNSAAALRSWNKPCREQRWGFQS